MDCCMRKDCQRCEVHFAQTRYYAIHHCLLLFTSYFGLTTEITGIRAKADVLLCLHLKTLRILSPNQNEKGSNVCIRESSEHFAH